MKLNENVRQLHNFISSIQLAPTMFIVFHAKRLFLLSICIVKRLLHSQMTTCICCVCDMLQICTCWQYLHQSFFDVRSKDNQIDTCDMQKYQHKKFTYTLMRINTRTPSILATTTINRNIMFKLRTIFPKNFLHFVSLFFFIYTLYCAILYSSTICSK